ncbi:helix-turn-helix domain-containing protein [Acholeplasma sp. OttesenSCG-928-E16]|nr:helix-turn-helix domain-containing protein [Acholeplasma sp. OttesenSCG-928-E16]
MEFCKTIAKKRKEMNMTQMELASKLGVSNKVISKWETGRSLPDVLMAKKVSEVLNIELEDLFDSFLEDEKKISDSSIKKSRISFTLNVVISGILLAVSAILYITYPSTIPIYFDGSLTPIRYGNKENGLWILLTMFIFTILFLIYSMVLIKKKTYMVSTVLSYISIGSNVILMSTHLFFSVLIFKDVSPLTGASVLVLPITNVLIGLFFISMGFILDFAKTKSQFFGVRLKISFTSDYNWMISQVIGKYVLIFTGLVTILLACLSNSIVYGMSLMIGIIIIPLLIIYLLVTRMAKKPD